MNEYRERVGLRKGMRSVALDVLIIEMPFGTQLAMPNRQWHMKVGLQSLEI